MEVRFQMHQEYAVPCKYDPMLISFDEFRCSVLVEVLRDKVEAMIEAAGSYLKHSEGSDELKEELSIIAANYARNDKPVFAEYIQSVEESEHAYNILKSLIRIADRALAEKQTDIWFDRVLFLVEYLPGLLRDYVPSQSRRTEHSLTGVATEVPFSDENTITIVHGTIDYRVDVAAACQERMAATAA